MTFEQITSLVMPLMQDKEHCVQNGPGWTLRELHNVYPARALHYLQQHIKAISSIAFTNAIEKMDLP